jgi:DNA-binding NarL/FixJ family response regulator
MSKEKSIVVGLVEDEKEDAKYFKWLLEDLQGIKISRVEIYRSGEDAIEKHDREISVFLIDYELGKGISGVQTLQALRKLNPHAKFIILTNNTYKIPDILDALDAGAVSYLRKREDKFHLAQAIQDACDGRWSTYTSVIKELIDHLRDEHRHKKQPSPILNEPLTNQEQKLLHLMGAAKTNEEIAKILAISTDKLKRNLLPSLYLRLNIITDEDAQTARMKAVIKALKAGAISLNDIDK